MQKEAESFEVKEEWKTRVDSNTQQKCGAAGREAPVGSGSYQDSAAIAKNDCTDKIAVVTTEMYLALSKRIVSYYKTFNEDRTKIMADMIKAEDRNCVNDPLPENTDYLNGYNHDG